MTKINNYSNADKNINIVLSVENIQTKLNSSTFINSKCIH